METNSGIFQLANGGAPRLTPDYILPQDKRPDLSQVSTLASIPIIDLNEDDVVVEKISKACEEYGFFQVINHGVPQELCDRMMAAITDFFELPAEEKAPYFTTDHSKQIKLYNYYIKVGDQENVRMWSETFSHLYYPSQDITHLLPENPAQYRETVAEYAKEIGELISSLLSLISKGLGLGKDCLENRLGERPNLKAQANYYPPCPDPELTLGLNVHTDFNAITVLRQSEQVTGLQVIKDGKWVAVNPVPNAFVINFGDQIQVLSNGRYKSVHHRAVTNKTQKRVSLAIFYAPDKDTVIGPIEDLIDEEHPPLYMKYCYSEFLQEFFRQEGTRRRVKEVFELKNQKKTS